MGELEGEVTRVLRRVARTLDRGKYNEALRELLRLSEKYPDAGEVPPQIAEVLLRRGDSRARKGRLREARDDWERSLQWSRNPAAYVSLALALISERKLERADELINTVLEMDDRYGPAHEAMGLLLLAWDEPVEATRAFEEALGCGHDTPDVYRSAWEAHMRADRPERAHDLVMEGADRYPEDDSLQRAAGDSFVYVRGDRDAAVPYWERAVELNPENFMALFSLAAYAAGEDRRNEALDLLRRAAKIDLNRARRLWFEDLDLPLKRFGAFAQDPEFLGALELADAK